MEYLKLKIQTKPGKESTNTVWNIDAGNKDFEIFGGFFEFQPRRVCTSDSDEKSRKSETNNT